MKAVIWANTVHIFGVPCTISTDDKAITLEDQMGVRLLQYRSIPGLVERYEKDEKFREQIAAFVTNVFVQFIQQDALKCLDLAGSLLNTDLTVEETGAQSAER